MRTSRHTRSAVERVPLSTFAAVLLALPDAGAEPHDAEQIRRTLAERDFHYAPLHGVLTSLDLEGLAEYQRPAAGRRRGGWRLSAEGAAAARQVRARVLKFAGGSALEHVLVAAAVAAGWQLGRVFYPGSDVAVEVARDWVARRISDPDWADRRALLEAWLAVAGGDGS